MIRGMFVLNSVNKKVQERLLETDDLDLSKALKIAKIHETNIEQLKLISNTDVHYVGSRRERKPATRQRYTAPLWEGRTERDPRPGGVPPTLDAAIAVESTLDKLALLKMRLSTIAGS